MDLALNRNRNRDQNVVGGCPLSRAHRQAEGNQRSSGSLARMLPILPPAHWQWMQGLPQGGRRRRRPHSALLSGLLLLGHVLRIRGGRQVPQRPRWSMGLLWYPRSHLQHPVATSAHRLSRNASPLPTCNSLSSAKHGACEQQFDALNTCPRAHGVAPMLHACCASPSLFMTADTCMSSQYRRGELTLTNVHGIR